MLAWGASPREPPLRFAPARWYFAGHRPLTGPEARVAVLAWGASREPPLRFAPARWYFAGTPAAHRAGGPGRWAGMNASP